MTDHPGSPDDRADRADRAHDRAHDRADHPTGRTTADAARGLPGSGLGLAIVRDVALAHGGTVFARARPGGGAAVGFTTDGARLLPDSEPHHVEASPDPITVDGS